MSWLQCMVSEGHEMVSIYNCIFTCEVTQPCPWCHLSLLPCRKKNVELDGKITFKKLGPRTN